MRVLLIFLTNISFFISPLTVEGQILYQDAFVKITGYINKYDSSLSFQIENLSDSVLLLNEKNINFEKIRNNEWSADLSLMTTTLSLLQPSYGHIMSFKRLLPKKKYTATAYNFWTTQNHDSFLLYIQIHYMVIPSNIFIADYILYRQFIQFVRKCGLELHSYRGTVKINESKNLCDLYLLE